MGKEILRMENISKSFPGVKALDDVNFSVYEGESMALLGENGAGKSTLMKILSGVYFKDAGKIYFDGEEVDIISPKVAEEHGIAIIHQELNLVPNLTVYENIFLGREKTNPSGRLDKKSMIEESKEILERLKVDINPRRDVITLSIAQQQMVEIAKALSLNAKIIIMDEPTDTLTDQEVESLFEVIKELKAQKKGLVYISHRLNEIFQVCNKITVLRDGQFIAQRNVEDVQENDVIELMVGRALDEQFPYVETKFDENILEVKNLTNQYINNISFNLKKGEILGVSGLVGAGRTELAKTLYGVYKRDSGEIILHGKSIDIKSGKEGLESGIAYVSEDRKADGLILSMDVKNNITISSLDKFIKKFRINKGREREISREYVEKVNIVTPSINQRVGLLSGGNQQKVAISKALLTDPDILILDEPTRGVDVGAKREIYDLLNEIKKEGKSIIMISSEMPEVLGMSDRIMVLHEGEYRGELSREEATQEKIMSYIMKGGNESEGRDKK